MVMRIQGISGNLKLQHELRAIAIGMHESINAIGRRHMDIGFPRILVPCPAP